MPCLSSTGSVTTAVALSPRCAVSESSAVSSRACTSTPGGSLPALATSASLGASVSPAIGTIAGCSRSPTISVPRHTRCGWYGSWLYSSCSARSFFPGPVNVSFVEVYRSFTMPFALAHRDVFTCGTNFTVCVWRTRASLSSGTGPVGISIEVKRTTGVFSGVTSPFSSACARSCPWIGSSVPITPCTTASLGNTSRSYTYTGSVSTASTGAPTRIFAVCVSVTCSGTPCATVTVSPAPACA